MGETGTDLTVSRNYSVKPEAIFDAWVTPELASKWLFKTPTGEMIRVEIDARVGGKFSIVRRMDGNDVDHVGEYEEVDRPRRLAFTFSVPKYSTQLTKVSVEITPSQEGCELTLTQKNVPVEWADRTREGWITLLESLSAISA